MRNFLAASDRRGWLLPEDKYIHTDTLARKIKLLATWTSSEYSCSGKIYLIKQPLPFTLSAPQPTDWTGLHMPIKSWCSVLVATVIKSIKPNCYRPLPNSSSLFVTRSKPWHGSAAAKEPQATQGQHEAPRTPTPAPGSRWLAATKYGSCTRARKKKWLLHGEGNPLLKMMQGFRRVAAICSKTLLSEHEVAKGSTTAR